MIPQNLKKKILIISNPVSGKGKATRIMNEFIDQLGVQNANFVVYETQKERDIPGIRHVIEVSKPDVISIIGGDGTIQNVINAIPDFSADIHILPGGTGNDLVYSFAGGKNYKKAFNTVFSENVRELDMGKCNGNLFVNGLGIGFDGEIVRRTQKKSTFLLPANWKYQIAVVIGVFGYKEFEAEFDSEKDYPKEHMMISVANGIMYGGGFKVAPDALPDDRLLDVISISNVKPLKRIVNLPKIKKGKHMHLPYITNHQTDKITISCGKTMPAHLDGEYFEAKDFVVELAVEKLRLLI
jgi:diacylglycerol kinase (ATP)